MRKFWMYMPAFLMVVMLTGCIVNPYKNGIEALENGRYEEAAKEFKEAVKTDVFRRLFFHSPLAGIRQAAATSSQER